MIGIIYEFSHKDKNFSSSRQHGIILHVPSGHLKKKITVFSTIKLLFMSFSDYLCYNCKPKLLTLRSAQTLWHSVMPTPAHLSPYEWGEGPHKRGNLLVPRKKVMGQPEDSPSPLTWPLSNALVTHIHTHTCAHTCTYTHTPMHAQARTHAHTLPQRWPWHSLTASPSWREFHGICSGLEDANQEDSKPCENRPLSRKWSVALPLRSTVGHCGF